MILLIQVCMGGVGISILFCLARFWCGPSLADRIMAVDTLALNLVALVGLTAMAFGTGTYFSLTLVFSLLGFLGTLCVAKYMDGGSIF